MELQALVDEYAADGIGDHLYHTLLATAWAVVLGRRYPPSYSPTGQWDEDAITAIVHEWVMNKLLARGVLEHILLSNRTLRGFRIGLELSFRDYLISQRKRTALDHLFRRANDILERDSQFRLAVTASTKAARAWGRAEWEPRPPFQGAEGELIAAGFRIRDVAVIRYRDDARKLSPILSDPDLTAFLLALLDGVGRPLRLDQIMAVITFRFNLVGVELVSLDEPIGVGSDSASFTWLDVIPGEPSCEDGLVDEDLARAVLRELSPRQQRVLVEYARPDATLTSVAARVGCSKSTVDNELRRALALIARQTDSGDEADRVHRRLLELLSLEPIPPTR